MPGHHPGRGTKKKKKKTKSNQTSNSTFLLQHFADPWSKTTLIHTLLIEPEVRTKVHFFKPTGLITLKVLVMGKGQVYN
jgi:hypothetical protein